MIYFIITFDKNEKVWYNVKKYKGGFQNENKK